MTEVKNLVNISGTCYISLPKVFMNNLGIDKNSKIRLTCVDRNTILDPDIRKEGQRWVLVVEKED